MEGIWRLSETSVGIELLGQLKTCMNFDRLAIYFKRLVEISKPKQLMKMDFDEILIIRLLFY